MGVQSANDCVHEFTLQVRQVCELFFRIVRSLLNQDLRFHQLATNHIVDIHQLVIVRQLAFEEVVDLFDNLVEIRIFLLLNCARSGLSDRLETERLFRLCSLWLS
jgi:hypothetical protein